jgi:UDPglucose--hexose-1-phosphate uridylyltransferase
MSFLETSSHRRFNPLTGEWVLVSPHRTQRPWQGQTERSAEPQALEYDPTCYLCPGNHRAHGATNPTYEHTFVFDNDFPALLAGGAGKLDRHGLMVAEEETGICRVICFSPRHDLTLARMDVADIERVIAVWREQYRELGAMDGINAVQIFENRGEMMGASNPHPHCQVWATRALPNEMAKELATQTEYWREHGSPLLIDYLRLERGAGERIVFENEHFTVVVPFWAIWPFETMVLPRRHIGALDELRAPEATALAAALRELTTRYDNLFETSFPIRWASTSDRPMARPIRNGSCTRISCRHSCVRRRCASSWSDSSCSVRRSATSRRRRRRRACAPFRPSTIATRHSSARRRRYRERRQSRSRLDRCPASPLAGRLARRRRAGRRRRNRFPRARQGPNRADAASWRRPSPKW